MILISSVISLLLCVLTCQPLPSAAQRSAVALYQSERNVAANFSLHSEHNSLKSQLRMLDLDVSTIPADRQSTAADLTALSAYIILAQDIQVFISESKNLAQCLSFMDSGGLVIVLDAGIGEGTATRDFISKTLNYNGHWVICQQSKQPCTPMRSHRSLQPGLSRWARSFLPDGTGGRDWPASLEAVRLTGVSSWCHHQDPDAVAVPLYNLAGDDDTALVAQAFGRLGSPGAVVWLGYSWRDGPQEQWGGLLLKMITDWARGLRGSALSGHPSLLSKRDVMPAAAIDLEEAQLGVIHRSLADAAGVYPPPPSPEPPSPRPSPPKDDKKDEKKDEKKDAKDEKKDDKDAKKDEKKNNKADGKNYKSDDRLRSLLSVPAVYPPSDPPPPPPSAPPPPTPSPNPPPRPPPHPNNGKKPEDGNNGNGKGNSYGNGNGNNGKKP